MPQKVASNLVYCGLERFKHGCGMMNQLDHIASIKRKPAHWLKAVREWLNLDEPANEQEAARHWQLSVFKIIVTSSIFLCFFIAVNSFTTALSLRIFSVIFVIFTYYILLLLALKIATPAPKIGAALLLLMIYGCGLIILLSVDDYALSDLGVIFLYVAPVIAWIYFGSRLAILLMAVNVAPFLYMLSSKRPLVPLGFNMLLPESHAYLHALIFLFFNISIPLAFFRVFSALNKSSTRIQEINKKLRRSNALYEDMFEHASGPTLICNQGGRILKANQKVCTLLERPLQQELEIGVTLEELFESTTFSIRMEALLSLARAAGVSESEFITREVDGPGKEVLVSVKSLSQRCLLVGVRDISSLRRMQRELTAAQEARDHLITFDYLTNLPNRDYLLEKLRKVMGDRSMADDGTTLAIISVRLNSIRSVNEKFGHSVGDELIKEFAQRLALQQRPNVLPFRLRGVVFLLLVTDCETQDTLQRTMESFRAALPKYLDIGSHSIELDVSFGAALSSSNEVSVNELIHRSERALEVARKVAHGPMVLFNEDSAREIRREIEIELALTAAIRQRELSIVYQPKVDENRHLTGLEALLRWNSAELGPVSPVEFIPIAERNGKIHAITDFVIEHVCFQLREWLDAHGTAWPVAINLSGIDLQREDMSALVVNAARRHRVEPMWLHMEITETGLIEDDNIARENLQRLMAAGFNITIDDFGTGYSSLKKLSEYPVSTIKIDRSFVFAIDKNPRSEKIIQLVLTLARFLKCETIAEGVETDRQLQFLLDNGCKQFQGYLFFRPLPPSDIDTLLSVDAKSI